MRRVGPGRAFYWLFHYGLLACFVAFALFPLFWLLKVSLTPNDLLYSEGVRFWPSRVTLAHYVSVVGHTQFPLYFRNSVIVSTATATISTWWRPGQAMASPASRSGGSSGSSG